MCRTWWKDKGRYVRKGEKALTLCQPVTIERRTDDSADHADAEVFTRFGYRQNWFVLAQTDGQAVEPPPMPDWDQARALATLGIIEEPFALTDANSQG